MNRLTVSLMVAGLCAGVAFGQTNQKASRGKVTGSNTAAAEELKRIARAAVSDWTERTEAG